MMFSVGDPVSMLDNEGNELLGEVVGFHGVYVVVAWYEGDDSEVGDTVEAAELSLC